MCAEYFEMMENIKAKKTKKKDNWKYAGWAQKNTFRMIQETNMADLEIHTHTTR